MLRSMTDWKALARARGLEIPEEEIDRIAPALDQLERSFRPLAATIPEEVEPAVMFRAEEGE
jgi:hypothetical protein